MMKVLGIVILYHPDIEELKKNIDSYLSYIDRLLIWDNTFYESEGTSENIQLNSILDYYGERVKYLSENNNKYIAYPLNKAIEYATKYDFSYLLTMDQDSRFVGESFKIMLEWIKNEENIKLNFAFCSNPNGAYIQSEKILELNNNITSGTVYKVSHFARIGLFREDFKIDGVDFDMSYKARSFGLNVLINPNVELSHSFGNIVVTKYGFVTDNYSVFRLYQIVRNHIRLWIEYPKEFKTIRNNFIKQFILGRIAKVILSEKNKFKKVCAILAGIFDGVFNSYIFNFLK